MRLNFFARKNTSQTLDIEALIRRIDEKSEVVRGIAVTPETALQSPTVFSVVSAISRKIASLPIHVFKKTEKNGLTVKEQQPNHPVAKLLSSPNDWQTNVDYWLDAVSWLLRYGRFYAFKSRGKTGPIRQLIPLTPSQVTTTQRADLSIEYRYYQNQIETYDASQVHHVRSFSVDGVDGISPIERVRNSIALEIGAEKLGLDFFGNGAMPLMVMQYMEGSQGHANDEARKKFIEEVNAAYSGRGRFRTMLLPKGIEMKPPTALENNKAQFIETRKYQRTVIAGAFGVPPHLVGDLERASFNNVEQQSLDFVTNVVLPYVRIFEAAMERDLLTDSDRAQGIIIRFNIDAALRGDFKSRQEGLQIMRQNGVINANEWRENENMNPLPEKKGGDEYWRQGPSGQSASTNKPAADTAKPDDQAGDNPPDDENEDA